MIACFFEPRHRVLMVRIDGVFGSDELRQLDDAVTRIVAREGAISSIYDFTDLQAVAVPAVRTAQRAHQPTVVEGLRVVVASRTLAGDALRDFSAQQGAAGMRAMIVVDRLEAAYARLGLDYQATFAPVELG